MKSLKFVFTKIMFVILISTSPGISGDILKYMSEAEQIQSTLRKIDFERFAELPATVKVSFMINGKNELIVVNTNNKNLDGMIKSAMNYKQIAVTDLEYGKIYTIPVKIEK